MASWLEEFIILVAKTLRWIFVLVGKIVLRAIYVAIDVWALVFVILALLCPSTNKKAQKRASDIIEVGPCTLGDWSGDNHSSRVGSAFSAIGCGFLAIVDIGIIGPLLAACLVSIVRTVQTVRGLKHDISSKSSETRWNIFVSFWKIPPDLIGGVCALVALCSIVRTADVFNILKKGYKRQMKAKEVKRELFVVFLNLVTDFVILALTLVVLLSWRTRHAWEIIKSGKFSSDPWKFKGRMFEQFLFYLRDLPYVVMAVVTVCLLWRAAALIQDAYRATQRRRHIIWNHFWKTFRDIFFFVPLLINLATLIKAPPMLTELYRATHKLVFSEEAVTLETLAGEVKDGKLRLTLAGTRHRTLTFKRLRAYVFGKSFWKTAEISLGQTLAFTAQMMLPFTLPSKSVNPEEFCTPSAAGSVRINPTLVLSLPGGKANGRKKLRDTLISLESHGNDSFWLYFETADPGTKTLVFRAQLSASILLDLLGIRGAEEDGRRTVLTHKDNVLNKEYVDEDASKRFVDKFYKIVLKYTLSLLIDVCKIVLHTLHLALAIVFSLAFLWRAYGFWRTILLGRREWEHQVRVRAVAKLTSLRMHPQHILSVESNLSESSSSRELVIGDLNMVDKMEHARSRDIERAAKIGLKSHITAIADAQRIEESATSLSVIVSTWMMRFDHPAARNLLALAQQSAASAREALNSSFVNLEEALSSSANFSVDSNKISLSVFEKILRFYVIEALKDVFGALCGLIVLATLYRMPWLISKLREAPSRRTMCIRAFAAVLEDLICVALSVVIIGTVYHASTFLQRALRTLLRMKSASAFHRVCYTHLGMLIETLSRLPGFIFRWKFYKQIFLAAFFGFAVIIEALRVSMQVLFSRGKLLNFSVFCLFSGLVAIPFLVAYRPLDDEGRSTSIAYISVLWTLSLTATCTVIRENPEFLTVPSAPHDAAPTWSNIKEILTVLIEFIQLAVIVLRGTAGGIFGIDFFDNLQDAFEVMVPDFDIVSFWVCVGFIALWYFVIGSPIVASVLNHSTRPDVSQDYVFVLNVLSSIFFLTLASNAMKPIACLANSDAGDFLGCSDRMRSRPYVLVSFFCVAFYVLSSVVLIPGFLAANLKHELTFQFAPAYSSVVNIAQFSVVILSHYLSPDSTVFLALFMVLTLVMSTYTFLFNRVHPSGTLALPPLLGLWRGFTYLTVSWIALVGLIVVTRDVTPLAMGILLAAGVGVLALVGIVVSVVAVVRAAREQRATVRLTPHDASRTALRLLCDAFEGRMTGGWVGTAAKWHRDLKHCDTLLGFVQLLESFMLHVHPGALGRGSGVRPSLSQISDLRHSLEHSVVYAEDKRAGYQLLWSTLEKLINLGAANPHPRTKYTLTDLQTLAMRSNSLLLAAPVTLNGSSRWLTLLRGSASGSPPAVQAAPVLVLWSSKAMHPDPTGTTVVPLNEVRAFRHGPALRFEYGVPDWRTAVRIESSDAVLFLRLHDRAAQDAWVKALLPLLLDAESHVLPASPALPSEEELPPAYSSVSGPPPQLQELSSEVLVRATTTRGLLSGSRAAPSTGFVSLVIGPLAAYPDTWLALVYSLPRSDMPPASQGVFEGGARLLSAVHGSLTPNVAPPSGAVLVHSLERIQSFAQTEPGGRVLLAVRVAGAFEHWGPISVRTGDSVLLGSSWMDGSSRSQLKATAMAAVQHDKQGRIFAAFGDVTELAGSTKAIFVGSTQDPGSFGEEKDLGCPPLRPVGAREGVDVVDSSVLVRELASNVNPEFEIPERFSRGVRILQVYIGLVDKDEERSALSADRYISFDVAPALVTKWGLLPLWTFARSFDTRIGCTVKLHLNMDSKIAKVSDDRGISLQLYFSEAAPQFDVTLILRGGYRGLSLQTTSYKEIFSEPCSLSLERSDVLVLSEKDIQESLARRSHAASEATASFSPRASWVTALSPPADVLQVALGCCPSNHALQVPPRPAPGASPSPSRGRTTTTSLLTGRRLDHGDFEILTAGGSSMFTATFSIQAKANLAVHGLHVPNLAPHSTVTLTLMTDDSPKVVQCFIDSEEIARFDAVTLRKGDEIVFRADIAVDIASVPLFPARWASEAFDVVAGTMEEQYGICFASVVEGEMIVVREAVGFSGWYEVVRHGGKDSSTDTTSARTRTNLKLVHRSLLASVDNTLSQFELCAEGHPMISLTVDKDDMRCTSCSMPVAQGTTTKACKACDKVLCPLCSAVTEVGDHRDGETMIATRSFTPHFLPRGVLFAFTGPRACHLCETLLSVQASIYSSCDACNFHVCAKCRQQADIDVGLACIERQPPKRRESML